jgi:putative transposase
MKTLTYTVVPSAEQIKIIDDWLETLRHVWNKGLALLLELERFSTYNKFTKERYPSMPIFGGIVDDVVIAPWQYRWMKDDAGKWLAIPFTPLTSFDSYRRPYRPCCPTPLPYTEPRLDRPSDFSLAKLFAHKRNEDWTELQAVPANFIRGVIASLVTAWKEYKKGRMGEPRFKGIRHGVTTLANADAKKILIRDGKIRVPLLGEFEIKAGAVWDNVPISVLKLCKMPWGYQLQLTGELPEKLAKPSKRAAVFEFPRGEGILYRDDKGKEVAAYENQKLQKRLLKLQEQLAEKQRVRQNRINKHGQHIPQSKAELELRRLIKSVEWKLAKGADQHCHKLSTYAIRTFGSIDLQPVITTPIPHPEPIPTSEGYAPNGAERIARFNKKVMRLRTGKFRALLKTKAEKHQRVLAELK